MKETIIIIIIIFWPTANFAGFKARQRNTKWLGIGLEVPFVCHVYPSSAREAAAAAVAAINPKYHKCALYGLFIKLTPVECGVVWLLVINPDRLKVTPEEQVNEGNGGYGKLFARHPSIHPSSHSGHSIPCCGCVWIWSEFNTTFRALQSEQVMKWRMLAWI